MVLQAMVLDRVELKLSGVFRKDLIARVTSLTGRAAGIQGQPITTCAWAFNGSPGQGKNIGEQNA
jgi:hypothetical protein